ncbi:hypothetical protein BT96DRAFT_991582 [Gymnopus androsaceus JB14]|uniref:Uncharacterized protein n=1 Tax=Gymnopus androsaceus JB14 TaxID=1447944 RepID=A0A6A4HUP7_9AGAR|nr:hypothetical protein BT96DRAFT_991582 [Gymnopus androsaceus JB14]
MCSITTLILVDAPLTSYDLTSALELTLGLTNLTALNSSRQTLCAPSCRAFGSFKPHSPLLVPKLASLILHFPSSWFDEEIFVEVVASRWAQGNVSSSDAGIERLRSVELHCLLDGKIDEDAYEALRVFQKDGLRLSLTGSY